MSDRLILTTKDLCILETILDRAASTPARAPFAAMLRDKLRRATVVLRDDVPPDVATMNSRVTYRLRDEEPRSVLLVQGEARDLPSFVLSVHSAPGLALLGLGEGGGTTLPDGSRIHLLAVSYQPERTAKNRMPSMQEGVLPFRSRATFRQRAGLGDLGLPDEDPGPGAA